MNARFIPVFRQDQNTYFSRTTVRVGNNVSEVTHLVPAQCKHPLQVLVGLIILQGRHGMGESEQTQWAASSLGLKPQ